MKPEEKDKKLQVGELSDEEMNDVTGGMQGMQMNFPSAASTMQYQPGMNMGASTMQYQPGMGPMQGQTLEQNFRLANNGTVPNTQKNTGGTHSL